MKRVVVGLSGGVDSSVAAWLLQQQGYDVVGLFMRNWHDTTGTLSGDCPWEDDQLFAELVAKRLDIPFHWVDLADQYRTRVVDYMFAEYERGRTPNPDVLCNREIKFDVFLKEALKLGADYVATGHYCRVERTADGLCRLLAGVDGNKDQSYFLCQLSQEQLSRAIFPIGGLLKPEVRRIAEEQKLATAKRKDSQGICFVGKVDLPTFLQQKLAAKNGDIIEIPADWSGYGARAIVETASLTAEPADTGTFQNDTTASAEIVKLQNGNDTGTFQNTAAASGSKTPAALQNTDLVTLAVGSLSPEAWQNTDLATLAVGSPSPGAWQNTKATTTVNRAAVGSPSPGAWQNTDHATLAAPYLYTPADGTKVGEHNGAHFYTIGQRKGLNVGGKAEPLFVIATDVERNIVYVGQGEAHPGLFRRALHIAENEIHWVRPDRALPPGTSERFSIRIRYRQPLQGGVLTRTTDGAYIVFDRPQRGITAGQFAAWYDGDELIGSGVILR